VTADTVIASIYTEALIEYNPGVSVLGRMFKNDSLTRVMFTKAGPSKDHEYRWTAPESAVHAENLN